MEEFEGYKVPEPLSKASLDNYVRDFNRGCCACHGDSSNDLAEARFACAGIGCDHCLFALARQDPDDVRKRCCARWLEYKGYKITRKGIRDNMNNTIYIKKLNSDWDIVNLVVKGWLKTVAEIFKGTDQYIYTVRAEPGSLGVHVDVYECAEERSAGWLYAQFEMLFRALRQINGGFQSSGTITWEHGDHTHVIEAKGTTLNFDTIQPVQEKTIKELEEELGYKIKIVGDRK